MPLSALALPTLLLLTVLASACGKASEPAAPTPKIFSQERESLDKAKAMEDTVKQQAGQRRDAIDDAASK